MPTNTGLAGPVKTFSSELRNTGQNLVPLMHYSILTDDALGKRRITPPEYATVMRDHSLLTY